MMGRLRLIALGAVCMGLVAGASVALTAPPLPSVAPAGARSGPYTPPACVPGVSFADITCTTGFDPWIEQFGADGITAGCGGGKYCPGTPVTRDQMAVFIEKAMRGTASWPAHTQLVWAVKASNGAPDPVASGTELLNAAAAIPTSGNDVPSGSNPWLLKVGPGIFDLGTSGLSLPAWVNLDGAGEGATTITAANDTWYTVASSSYNTISNLTIVNTGGGANTYAVYANGTSLELDHARVQATGGTSNDVGIFANNSVIRLNDGEVIGDTIGIYTAGTPYNAVWAWRTLFSASADIYNAAGYTINLINASVPDALDNFGTGVFHCIGNYNSTLAPVTCP